MDKQIIEFLREKGITGDFSTKRMIPTVEKGELIVDWFQEFTIRALINFVENYDSLQMNIGCYTSEEIVKDYLNELRGH